MKNNKKWLSIVLTAIIVTFVCAVGMPVSANGASVTRGLPDAVKTNEEFVVTLTQSGFLFNAGTVNETLPEGFTYLGSLPYDNTTNNLTIDFEDETTVTYNVTASSYDQIPAEFSGTYKTFTAEMEVETGAVGGDIEVVVDGTLPYTDGHNPEKGATDVSVDTNIVVHVKDDGAGVDHSTIVMTVNSAPVTPTIVPIGLTLNFSVTYAPPEDFGYEQVVDVTIEASDLAGNAMTTDSYSFTTEALVTEKSDLVVTEKWVCWPDNCTICYNITNICNGTAPADHNTTLYVDEVEVAHDQVPVLAPNASYIGCFEDAWVYTPSEDNITICADNDKTVDESDEGNNCLTNVWVCGDVNGDGDVTPYDKTMLGLYVGEVPGWTTITNEWAADVSGDGAITSYDKTVLGLVVGEVSGWELNCKCS